jgi:hypothetical protein
VAVNVIRVAVAKIKVEINVRVTLIFTFDLQRVNRLFRSRPTVAFSRAAKRSGAASAGTRC